MFTIDMNNGQWYRFMNFVFNFQVWLGADKPWSREQHTGIESRGSGTNYTQGIVVSNYTPSHYITI